MIPYQSIEPVLTDDNRKPIFYVTWESTLKCNLDCTYCGKDAHDNSVPHPSLEECLDTADFLLEYANLYMSKRNENHAFRPYQKRDSIEIVFLTKD
jgi:sulfatase maturation enzyme AslB (radical SAM superfamily)